MSNSVQVLLAELSLAATNDTGSNAQINRNLWNRYANEWEKDAAWVLDMASSNAPVDSDRLQTVGDEWSDRASLHGLMNDFVLPHVSPAAVVVEIGVGGGRLARFVAPHCGEFWGFDLSSAMLAKARKALPDAKGLKLRLVGDDCRLPAELAGRVHFAYCLDMFPHCSLHVLRRYLRQVHQLLSPGGKFAFSTANLCSERGYRRFAQQTDQSVKGFIWTDPTAVKFILAQEHFKVVTDSLDAQFQASSSNNLYYARDYVCLVAKKTE